MKTLIAATSALFAAAFAFGQDAASTALNEPVPEHVATTPAPRDGGWMKRHESMNERTKKGGVDLAFVGDSITQGWEGKGRKVWEEFYGKRNAANYGISGDRTEHVLWRIDNGNFDGISPKLIVIMIGTNNTGHKSSDAGQTADGIRAILQRLQKKTPDSKILLLGVFPRGATPDDAMRKMNEEVNAKIKAYADGKKIQFLDIGDKFLGEDGKLSREVMPDLLHLNEASYRTWAEAIEPKVKELLGE
ncbi:MAG: platelet-activating factor acetylhydrolase IB subunit [Verrucomicrobiales bacterium]